jgi:serine phosphatase RsbU (regulator of sigma subunit)
VSEPSPALLVVDDSPFNRLLLKRRLAELGYPEPDMAENGVQALEAVARRKYDAMLLDLEMPEMDGIGVLERLKGEPPVIVISAHTEMSGVIRCIELGAEDYLPKTFEPPLLRARLSAVLEKKRLRDLAAERLNALEAELESARRAQLALVPRDFAALSDARVAVCAHMEPAREVGGDLYDFLALGPEHLLFAVADVAGKGAPAGMTMARSFGLIRAAARQAVAEGRIPDPGALLAQANDDLAEGNTDMTFVTAALGVIERASGQGRIAIAGHEAPLFLRAGGCAAMTGYRRQPALGIIEGIPFASEAFALAPGEGLLLVTDGVTEGQNHARELYGRARMESAVGSSTAPDEVVRHLLADLAAFVDGAPPADDVTLLALRFG